MKLSQLEYARPGSVDEAIALLQANEGAKIISGGQSLIPVLAFRLSAPPLLVDIGKLEPLRQVTITAGQTRLGARVRWCEIERHTALRVAQPLLAAMIDQVAHYQIRNRGTVGGSLAHADPAAEMPGVAVVCDAVLRIAGPAGIREVPAAEFFVGPLQTVLADEEIILEVMLPAWPASRRWAFEEFARRQGDFALAGVAAHYDIDAAGLISNMHVGVIGADLIPRRLHDVEALLNGRRLDAALIEQASALAAASVNPMSDLHADAHYRKALVGTLLERVLHRSMQTQ
ncbi:xanthine dehydrogenase family protein subunit M [Ferrovibrio sp.]|uniref:FAD binding domain-containing protein n=1 Tax=Ferrovibrio sp. TaxID=1917215 RepID=UPI001B3DA5D7|nr:xanthine dehydrogenase family protein subunit M [Ferrovibrio sp.]MBP7065653.1 xanthine dehydrogenase family protein subunit M [Ferrovibrio sp.]